MFLKNMEDVLQLWQLIHCYDLDLFDAICYVIDVFPPLDVFLKDL